MGKQRRFLSAVLLLIFCGTPGQCQNLVKEEALTDSPETKNVLNGLVSMQATLQPATTSVAGVRPIKRAAGPRAGARLTKPATGPPAVGVHVTKLSADAYSAGLHVTKPTADPFAAVVSVTNPAASSYAAMVQASSLSDTLPPLHADLRNCEAKLDFALYRFDSLAKQNAIKLLSSTEIREKSYGITGIDIQAFLLVDGPTSIVTVYPFTPAYFAGIIPGDKLLKVDDTFLPTAAGSRLDAWKILTGPPGSPVTLTVEREGKTYRVSTKRMNIEDIDNIRSRRYFEYLFSVHGAVNNQ